MGPSGHLAECTYPSAGILARTLIATNLIILGPCLPSSTPAPVPDINKGNIKVVFYLFIRRFIIVKVFINIIITFTKFIKFIIIFFLFINSIDFSRIIIIIIILINIITNILIS